MKKWMFLSCLFALPFSMAVQAGFDIDIEDLHNGTSIAYSAPSLIIPAVFLMGIIVGAVLMFTSLLKIDVIGWDKEDDNYRY